MTSVGEQGTGHTGMAERDLSGSSWSGRKRSVYTVYADEQNNLLLKKVPCARYFHYFFFLFLSFIHSFNRWI